MSKKQRVKFGVITFPGSNCDDDMLRVLETMDDVELVRLWHKDVSTQGCNWVILPGGFSYGDYLRSGAIAKFSPIMKAVVEHAKKGGYVLGVCNGFQILTEAELLPGTLLHNDSQRFICKNVHIKVNNRFTVLTKGLSPELSYKIPIAHGEGRFYAPDYTLKEMEDNEQIVFQYSNFLGEVNEVSNPNGSTYNIAGICNKQRNVFGMMPHPERAADISIGNTDGRFIFESIVNNS